MDNNDKPDYSNIKSTYSEISWRPPKSEDLIAGLKPNPTIIGGTKTYNYPMFGSGTASYSGKVGIPLLVNSVIGWQLDRLGNGKVNKWDIKIFNDNTFRIINNLNFATRGNLLRMFPERNKK